MAKIEITRGAPANLGAHPDGDGVNFALFSAHAERVELCLFDEMGTETRLALPARTGNVWHGHLRGGKAGQVYGYRVHGPRDPENGHLFDPGNVLLDPYARELTPDMKSRVCKKLPPVGKMPQRPWQDTVIYESHLRGMTMEFPGIPDDIRGTCKGFAHDDVVAHLKKLGVTAVELMPVQACADEQHLKEKGLTNYWGYNPAGFFALNPRYGSRGDFRAMTKKIHDAGIEVILDVVYNHTCEGKPDMPSLSFRGIDNASYYRPDPHDKGRYDDYSGCGNTLDTTKPPVRKIIVDSLRYWVEEMGVDGFRFDLAMALFRNERGEFDSGHPLFTDIAADPALSKVKLIAEPWDTRGYVLGQFPAGWHEWNDRFRDHARAYWRGDAGMAGHKATRLAGSHPEFGHKGNPAASINFITAHDGFTLQDIVSYNGKRNLANGEGNRDGHNNNISCNHGIDGATSSAAIIARRDRHKRALLASLFLSQGTPMMLSGDECGNGQDGNNNAYCQDNPTGWVNWKDSSLTDFIANLSKLRHDFPVLRHHDFLHGFNRCAHGEADIRWFAPGGDDMKNHHWNDPQTRSVGLLLNGGALGKESAGERLFMIFNAHSHTVPFRLPALGGGDSGWKKIFDTARPDGIPDDGGKVRMQGHIEKIESQTVAVFSQTPRPKSPGDGQG